MKYIAVALLVLPVFPANSFSPGLIVASDASQPHLAIDSSGVIYVTFIHKGNISVAISTDKGKSFGEPVVAIDVKGRAQGGCQRGPRIGVDAKQVLTVTAPVTFDEEEYKQRYPRADLYFVASTDGGKTWSKPTMVNEVPKKAAESLHEMAVSSNGDTHVVWLDNRDRAKGQDVFYARISAGKVGKNVLVATQVCECCAPGLSVDEKGNPFVAWREGGKKPSREILCARSTDQGASFGAPTQVNRAASKVGG